MAGALHGRTKAEEGGGSRNSRRGASGRTSCGSWVRCREIWFHRGVGFFSRSSWSGLSAQLRTHGNGVIAWKNTQPDTEICVAIHGNRSVITRQGGGIFDRTVVERGTIWLCPAGLQEDYIDISDPVPGILHIYLPPSHFSPNSLGVDLDKSVIASLRYENGFQDPLVAEIAYAIVSELQTETPAGRLLAETLACSLAARLVQNRVSSSPAQASPRITK